MICPTCLSTLSSARVYRVCGVLKCGVCRTVLTDMPTDNLTHTLLPSEVAVYIRNPQTGEVRVPGRADRPIHPKYQAAGFTERVEIRTGREMNQFERRTGLIHERSSYNNSGRAERDTGAC